MTPNTSNIALALTQGTSIRNKTAARVTGDKVGLTAYSEWHTALTGARMPFYRHAKAIEDTAIVTAHGDTATDFKPIEDAAMQALQTVLDTVGEVHGYKLHKSRELLSMLSVCALKDSEELVGEAYTVASQVKNYKEQLRNGGNDEFIANIEKKLSEAEEKLSELKKLPGSCKPADGATTLNNFIKSMERKLGKVVDKQYRKTPEQVEQEEAERKAKSKEKSKANRRAKRAAEKAAKEAAATEATTNA